MSPFYLAAAAFNLATAASAATSLVVSSTLPTTWKYQECRTDDVGARTLAGASYTNTTGMTEESCIQFCDKQNFIYAGVEWSQECYCANSLASGSSTALSTDCNMPCTGNSSEICGAGNRLSLFWSGKQAPAPPSVNPGPPGWTSLGCYSDNVNSRTLAQGYGVPGGPSNMTVAQCATVCRAGSFIYAGVEWAEECYCATIVTQGAISISTTSCNMPCTGNATELCGGSNAINLYQFGVLPPVVPSPSTTTSTRPTTSSTTSTRPTTSSTTTSTRSTSSSTTTSARPTTTSSTTSTRPTTTSTITTSRTTTTSLTTNSPTTTSPTTTSTITTTSASPSATTCPGANGQTVIDSNGIGYVVQCSSDSTINSYANAAASLNFMDCMVACDMASNTGCVGFVYVGGANGVGAGTCWLKTALGSYIPQGSNFIAAVKNSSSVGALSSTAGSTLTSQTSVPSPAVQKANLPGSWTYQGCYTDVISDRTLPNQIIFANNNSAQTCLSLCASYGYMRAGLEYGEECWCGDAPDITAAGSTITPETDCNDPCPGNGSYICGGGNRLSMYAWTGKPLYTFSYPTGNAAGSYVYFVPGVVVPLITVPGKNGKITFVEKSGTSEFANSTGAYELDPSFNGDFSQSWRTMTGIKTDVFCSAGLILPDAGARLINIGGWSGTSTYGVRFYTPDGSPGTTSINEWEENANEIALQAGRWYPSAMVMANGSILVVGGEDGSNGAPTPSLELLPKAGGTVYCDYLAATDPYNLYPFLAVLPSGGIFISYFNQARILDPVSFATIRTLPLQPGQVTNPTSGRTYPFEGTAVLMPQRAPYTDPLTILLCGGSGSGAAVAIDNCISTQPDDPNASWTLEKMPSKRVMSCMVALPDGTFLILNGAHQGVAGFGLATDPNYNAVLYDPSKPVNSRMSVMANTTIARLYHSEAVLMDDGRVLVSGSDPEDGTHPQEMRVEVFNPPYILSGAARPSLAVANDNWAYGQNVPITVSIPSGSTKNVKVTLLGAVASTHGNNMGQRTIFPAFSCSGSTCTVTAPPNANICPPGWFQLFVLDGPTPSHAVWVRIGGDPASLGEWPTFADFTRPGS